MGVATVLIAMADASKFDTKPSDAGVCCLPRLTPTLLNFLYPKCFFLNNVIAAETALIGGMSVKRGQLDGGDRVLYLSVAKALSYCGSLTSRCRVRQCREQWVLGCIPHLSNTRDTD
jgi:hypothetical protein